MPVNRLTRGFSGLAGVSRQLLGKRSPTGRTQSQAADGVAQRCLRPDMLENSQHVIQMIGRFRGRVVLRG